MQLNLNPYLEDIESRLDAAEEARLWDEWLGWTRHENGVKPFLPQPRTARPSALEWPHVNINDALGDDDLAIYRELEGVNQRLAEGSCHILRVRANYGVGNIASAFGPELFVMPRETDTLPNVRPFGEEAMYTLLDRPAPDLSCGNFPKIMRIYDRFVEIGRKYPKFGAFVRLEQPDLQGPMDNLELLWGSSVFYALYDDPDTIHALLGRITNLIESVMDEWLRHCPNGRGIATYFRHVEKGAIALRDDSAMNLSPDFFSEFIAPYDGRLLRKYGGIMHFCGRGDHFIERLAKLEGLNGINMSQPHLNDMDKVFAATIDKGLHLSLSTPSFDIGKHDGSNLLFLDSM